MSTARYLKELSLSEGIVRSEDFPNAIFFVLRARGLCTGGSSSGIFTQQHASHPLSNRPPKRWMQKRGNILRRTARTSSND